MSSTEKHEKPTSSEKTPEKKPSFLVEDAAAIEMTSESGKQSIQKIDPSLRSQAGQQMIEGEKAEPSHPKTVDEKKKPYYDEHGRLHS